MTPEKLGVGKEELEERPVSAPPLVSVILPVYNDAENLYKCLDSLRKQTYPQDRIEIIVVDNGSDQKLDGLIREFGGTVLLEEPTPGSYAARNLGISKSRGDVLGFLDSDCIADCNWLTRGVAALEGTDVVGGRMVLFYRDPNNPSPVELYDGLTSFRQKEYVEKARFSVTANLFAWRRVFDEVGLFDLSLKSGGDCEWGNRAHAAGSRLAYAEEAVVFHPARRTLAEVSRKQRRVGGGLGQKMRGPDGLRWRRLPRVEIIEIMIFLRLCREILLYGGIPLSKKIRMFLVNIAVSGLRIMELNKVLLGGKPLR